MKWVNMVNLSDKTKISTNNTHIKIECLVMRFTNLKWDEANGRFCKFWGFKSYFVLWLCKGKGMGE